MAQLTRLLHLRTVQAQSALLVALVGLLLIGGILASTHVSASIDEIIASTSLARQQAEAAQAVRSMLRDAESGQRGFLLTGRAVYLEPYNAAINRLEPLLDRLGRLAQNTPWLEADHAVLAIIARAKANELRHTIDVATTQGVAAATAIVNLDSGRAYMDEASIITMRIAERAEAERAKGAAALQSRQRTVSTILLLGLGGGVATLGGALLALLWNSARLQQARAGEQREAARLKATVDHVPSGVGVFDRDGRLTVFNERFADALDLPPALARPGAAFADVADAVSLVPPLLDGPVPTAPLAAEVQHGARTLEVWRSPMPEAGQMLTVTDVSRRVAAEEAARQSQKMDVLGQMTGGVAHDFNNLLQVVSANLELLRGRLVRGAGNEALVARLDAASAGVARGARLTRHLLAFARRQPLAPEPLDAARTLMGIEEVLRRTVGEGVSLELVVGGGLWFMRADPVQFENALLNLALNARDAMTGPDGTAKGRLTIEAANASLDEAYAARSAEVAPGQYVMFAITDTGTGMTAEQRARAIEPFYTTKPEGRGTGLGLPMVLGFAKQSGGHFQLYSEPGRGTTARIYIPRTTAPASRPDAAPLGLPTGEGQLILVVEDDPGVRQVARDALQGLNYQVVEADSADAALVMLEAGCRPRLLFTDVVMPGQSTARQMAARAQLLVPGLGVLFTSGYTQNSIVHNGQLDADVALISKPWREEDLARALRSVLDGTATRPPPRRRVLLVEDEELVRMTTADALAELGYEVMEAATAQGALARLHPPPDLLLTDLGLPDQDGLVLMTEVRRRLPALPVIVSSGQSDRPEGDLVWLAKPYDVEALRRAVSTAFAEPAA